MSDENAPEVEEPENSPEEQEPEGDKGREESFDADRAKAALNKKNSENANLRKRLAEAEQAAAKLKELEDAGKTESQRLVEDRDSHKSRAEKAETSLKKLQIALEAAPEGASLQHVRAVAKRLSGDNDDELTSDAEELYELLGAKAKPKVPGKPTERLSGGSDPDEPIEETDPRKLAELISKR